MICIVCDVPNKANSIEHIVPESMGNTEYLMDKCSICDTCNSKFSKFEEKALSNSIFIMERARLGIRTKKGKNAKGKVGDLTIQGHEEFKKQHVFIKGLNKESLQDFDPKSKTGSLTIKAFDKSEVATSKFLLKIGIESLFTSQKKLFKTNDFTELKRYLNNESNDNWPFITTDFEVGDFKSIPQKTIKYRLKNIKKIELKFFQKNERLLLLLLLFKFKYGGVSMIINLLNRDLLWIKDYKTKKTNTSIFPDHFEKKYDYIIQKTKTNK